MLWILDCFSVREQDNWHPTTPLTRERGRCGEDSWRGKEEKSRGSDRGWEGNQGRAERRDGRRGKRGRELKLASGTCNRGNLVISQLCREPLMCFTHPAKSTRADHWTINFNSRHPPGTRCLSQTSALWRARRGKSVCDPQIKSKRHTYIAHSKERWWKKCNVCEVKTKTHSENESEDMITSCCTKCKNTAKKQTKHDLLFVFFPDWVAWFPHEHNFCEELCCY